jgi:hypothetical protein
MAYDHFVSDLIPILAYDEERRLFYGEELPVVWFSLSRAAGWR